MPGWTKVRDLIVIRLYEKLHSMLARTANEDDTDDSVKKGEN